jgi:membrane protein implicated in regulation of membrane protease activity
LFSLFYQSFSYQRLTIIWVVLTSVIIVIELYRDTFYYPWSASLLQAVLFLLPYYFFEPVALLYGFLVNCALFVYIYKKLEFGGAR